MDAADAGPADAAPRRPGGAACPAPEHSPSPRFPAATSVTPFPPPPLAEYHAPYGRSQGQIPAAGRTTSLDGIFGMGEKKKIRL